MSLVLHRFGSAGGPRLTCLHGVTGYGGHFEALAERLDGSFDLVAPDLLGHGRSSPDPPWSIGAQVEAILEAAGDRPGTWLGHSFGARLAVEVVAARPDLADRLILLDPAIWLPPQVARFVAANALERHTYASLDEAVDRRYAESQLHGADRELVARDLARNLEVVGGRWAYRYQQAAIVTAYSELAAPGPAFERLRIRTLLVLGKDSYVSYEHLLEDHREAVGDLLEVVTVPGGHTVLWDAPDETAAAISSFLSR